MISSIARLVNFHVWIVGPFSRIASQIDRVDRAHMKKMEKNIYVRYMLKYIKYIFSESCIFKICFTCVLWPKVVIGAYIFHFHGGGDG